jgi:hypothetical protein
MIMKVNGFGNVENTSSVSKRRGTSSTTSFADLLSTGDVQEVSLLPPASDMAALNNLLALQEISEEDVRRKKMVQRGNGLLDSLEKLRGQLLVGSLAPAVIVDISRQMQVHKQMIDDPHMNEIIEDIELRAAVELAKLHKALDEKY